MDEKPAIPWDEQQTNWFCTVSHDKEQRDLLKEIIKEFPFWSYIDHKPEPKPDDKLPEENHEHTHFMWKTNGSYKIKHMAEQLGIPSHMIQPIGMRYKSKDTNRGKRAYGRYMLHLGKPDKIQYTLDDIKTNRPKNFKIWSQDNQDTDPRRNYEDLKKLSQGIISLDEYFDLHYIELCSVPFAQQGRLFADLEQRSNRGRVLQMEKFRTHRDT